MSSPPSPLNKNTAEYEDYSLTSKVYDTQRRAVGIDVCVNALKKKITNDGGDPSKTSSLDILDAGCGTGNYVGALLEATKETGYFNSIQAMDFNEGMVSQCKAKFEKHPDFSKIVNVQEGSLLELPFADGTFDAVLVNQVLHHLWEDKDDTTSTRDGEGALSSVMNLRRSSSILCL